MVKLFHAILTGLFGAALLHVVIILALPHFVKANAYARVEALGPSGRFYPLGASGETHGLVNEDPFLLVSACRIDIGEGPMRLFASGDVPLWSVVIFDRESNEVYSMSDRTSVTGDLDILLASSVQLPAIRKNLPEALAQSILVEMPSSGGYAVLRAFSPRASFKPDVQDFLGAAECSSWKQ